MRWVRLNIDFDDSPWLFVLSAESQLAWIKLLCHMKRDGVGGTCKALAPLVAAKKWGVGDESVVKMLQAAVADGALIVEGKEWTLTNWNAHQETDHNAAVRMRRYRERQAQGQHEDVTDVTRNNRNVTRNTRNACRVTETETETETSKEKILQKESSSGRASRSPSSGVSLSKSPPPLEEISAYFQSRNVPPAIATRESERFRDYHESRGWLVGRAPMRSWQAAVRTWIGNMGKWQEAPPPGGESRVMTASEYLAIQAQREAGLGA